MGRGVLAVVPLALVAALSFVGSVCFIRPALAADAPAAQALFNEGRRLMAERNYAAACPKLEESQRLDAGIGTQFNLADCYEHVGRTASAWAQFLEVAAAAKSVGQRARESSARLRASQLEPRLSRLVVVVDASRAPVGLVVKRDDVEVGAGQWGMPVPVDPGPHAITASAPGKTRWEARVVVGERGDRATATVPILEDAPADVEPEPEPSARSEAAPQQGEGAARQGDRRRGAAPIEAYDPHPGRTQRILGLLAGGVGLVGVGVGTGFGILAKTKHDDALAFCNAQNQCLQNGLTLRSDAIRAGTISTVSFVAGGVALAVGILLLVTAPSDPKGASRAWGLTPGGAQPW